MGKSEAVAALRSAAKACELCAGVASDTDAAEWRADAERVRALADALEQAQEAHIGENDRVYTDELLPVNCWVIDVPRLP